MSEDRVGYGGKPKTGPGRKLPHTPNSRIRQALRILWMRSRERAQALKNTNYCCAYCGVKQSTAKGREVRLDVHHLDPIDWDGLFDDIRRRLLHDPSRLAPACPDCHAKQAVTPATNAQDRARIESDSLRG